MSGPVTASKEQTLQINTLRKMLSVGAGAAVVAQKLSVHVQTEYDSDLITRVVDDLVCSQSVDNDDLDQLYELYVTKDNRTARASRHKCSTPTRFHKEEFLGLPVIQKMLSVGHSQRVVQQRLSSFLQVPFDAPVVERTIKALTTDQQIPSDDLEEMISLSRSKYARLVERGSPKDKVERIKVWERQSVCHSDLILADDGLSSVTLQEVPLYLPRRVNTVDSTCGDYGVLTGGSERSVSRTVEAQTAAEQQRQQTMADSLEAAEERLKSICKAAVAVTESCRLSPSESAQPEVISTTGPSVHPLTGLPVLGRTHVLGRILSSSPIISSELCKDIIKRMDFSDQERVMHLTVATKLISNGYRTVMTGKSRAILDSEIATLVWKAARNILPEKLDYGLVINGVRTSMKFICFDEGEYYDTHTDGGYKFADSSDISKFTFLLHLNDDYQGGELQYCGVDEWSGEGASPYQTCRQATFKAGELALFTHDTIFRSAPVTSGAKYVIHGMVMYRHTRVSRRKEPARFQALARAF